MSDSEARHESHTRLHIAFHPIGGSQWTAGVVYLQNLVASLKNVFDDALRLSIAAPGAEQPETLAREVGAHGSITYPASPRWTLPWMNSVLQRKLLTTDPRLRKTLLEGSVDVVFGPVGQLRFKGIACLSYIPDLQHRRLPEMFSEEERCSRDREFMRSARVSNRVFLPCEPARKDFEAFAPVFARKAVVLHPVSVIPDRIYEQDPTDTAREYHLPEKFVYMPNQFWKHKNHRAAFRAVKYLKDRGSDVALVCTGNTSDYRHPTYFAELAAEVSRDGTRDRIILLGLVPHDHVLLLMRQSVCVLNPSLFEGWGVTVDEARSVGKRVLVSDLPEHRNHNHPRADYFNPADPAELADRIERIWNECEPGPDRELEKAARRELPERIKEFAEDFVGVAEETLREVRGERTAGAGVRKQ